MGKPQNSLQNALDFKVAECYQEIKQEGPNPTISQVLELVRERGFKRIPQDLVKKQVQLYFERNNKMELEKSQNVQEASLNNGQTIIKKIKKDNQLYEKTSINQEFLIKKTPDLNQLGGLENILPQLKQMILLPIQHSNVFQALNISPPKGILLTGISGSGKTVLGLSLCKYLYEQLQIPFRYISATEITGGISGESENNLRTLFSSIQEQTPSVLFIDELDAIAGKKDNASKDMEKRVVIQLQQCLDSLNNSTLVIAACSKPENLDPALRRAGRFDKEFQLPVPDEKMRLSILEKMLCNSKVSQNVNIQELARNTPGYVPADLDSLLKESGLLAVQRIVQIEQLNSENSLETVYQIEMQDFNKALKTIQPTAKREGFAVVPDVCWEDIGALNELKSELYNSIILPIIQPQKFKFMGIDAPAGVLLYGPPGCGKTLLAKAVANASQANFIAIKGPELLNKYVGESEKAVRNLFSRARFSQPCIIFFDELDALCPKRGQDGNGSSERVVNQLLTEMQGLEDRQQVFVIAATNRPDMIDSAMLRPGRLDKLLYVPMPTKKDQIQILRACAKKCPIEDEVWKYLEILAEKNGLDGYSGADLEAVIKQAALAAILDNSQQINVRHFEISLKKVNPSLSKKDQVSYDKLRNLQENKSNFQNSQN